MHREGKQMQHFKYFPLPLVLITISIVPVAAGLMRLVQIAGAPIPLVPPPKISVELQTVFVLHVVTAIIFLVLGAFQFTAHSSQRKKRRHRVTGRVVVISALIVGVSAIWLTVFFPHEQHDGPELNIVRIFAGTGIVTSVVLGYRAIRTHRFEDHRKWMMRAYALGIGTGLQALAVIGWQIFSSSPIGLSRAIIFGASWLACLVIAEFRLARSTPNI